MSRVSSKSSLSPSSTSGSSAIDLGKDSGVNMGEKSQTSVSTGGIGVTREVANIGGVSVTGGVSVDVSPIRLDISGNPDYEDPSKSSISIGAGAEVPGGVLGVSGGVTINTSTGQVKGGSIGGEVVGIGINISKSSEGVGVGISLQIPFTPISFELGLEFPNDKKEKKLTPTPTPAPTPVPQANSISNCGNFSWVYVLPAKAEFWHTGANANIYPADRASELDNTWQRRMYDGDNGGNKNKLTDARERCEGYCAPGTGRTMRMHTWTTEQTTLGEPILIQTNSNSPNFPWIEVSRSGIHKQREVNCRVRRRMTMTVFYPDTINLIFSDTYPCGFDSPNQWWFRRFTWSASYIEQFVEVLDFPDCPNLPIPSPSPAPLFPPSPNPPPRKQMDECCRDSIKLLRQIHKRLGVNKFPGELPSTIIQEVEKGQPATEPVQEKIEDFADLLMWMFQRDDERWGQWQIQIDVKDTDLTKEGDQGKQIKFPNLAESIAEMEGQLLSLQANVAALVALSTRNLCESGMGRQEAIKAYLASMAIAKYMNFPYDESDIKMPSTFTPKAESIDELIKESIIHVKGIEYTNKETQRDILLDLLQAAAITRAVHWRQVDPKKDIKSQILESIKGSADLSDKLENPLAKEDDPSKPKHSKDWEDFLDQVEDGFGFETGIEDAQTPYGRSRERRPRIRQIGDNIGQAGKPNG
ncbi:MAG: hypothetical protein JGK30_17450 [Microcoleus sp. PH2017_40_RAT_O_B]|uniref:hypothetical protein n=1 Tax=unclassified Microcoleus TaxID=2642155 RepID=UPI001D61FEC3|nr:MULTISPECIES: hypothetical protein [unclassified Microcoleus]MCC3573804.1 hypothetical protein [Microcoleus sp. PH2017_34_RAT_O_A]MCC3611213.1 hypothetical protein [Microcoleus sp. PH2017_40_RAT_O_B]